MLSFQPRDVKYTPSQSYRPLLLAIHVVVFVTIVAQPAAATVAESSEEAKDCVGAAPAKRPPMERAGSIRLMDKSISITVCYNISRLRRPQPELTFELQQGEKEPEAWGDDAAGDLKPRVRLRRHVLDVLRLGHIPLLAHCGLFVRQFTSNSHRSCQVTCSSCLATTPLSAGSCQCLLPSLVSSPALRPHTVTSFSCRQHGRLDAVGRPQPWSGAGPRRRWCRRPPAQGSCAISTIAKLADSDH